MRRQVRVVPTNMGCGCEGHDNAEEKLGDDRSVTEDPLLIGSIALGITVTFVTLFAAAGAWREGRRISRVLDVRHSRLEEQLERARFERSEALQKVQQLGERLEEQRPEKLTWELQQVREELEQLRHVYSETQRQVGQQKQEWLHQSEQQEQQRLRLEQERQHLMEELERWHERYVEARQQIGRLEQERSDAQQKVEHLTQLREKLLMELREIDKE
jgi:chromosome segregation ATPase